MLRCLALKDAGWGVGAVQGWGMAAAIRIATALDVEQIAAIYAPAIEGSCISFETRVPDASEMRRRVLGTLERFPWLVCEHEAVIGYAYAGPHRERAAYA